MHFSILLSLLLSFGHIFYSSNATTLGSTFVPMPKVRRKTGVMWFDQTSLEKLPRDFWASLSVVAPKLLFSFPLLFSPSPSLPLWHVCPRTFVLLLRLLLALSLSEVREASPGQWWRLTGVQLRGSVLSLTFNGLFMCLRESSRAWFVFASLFSARDLLLRRSKRLSSPDYISAWTSRAVTHIRRSLVESTRPRQSLPFPPL